MSETNVRSRSVQGAIGALGELVNWVRDSREAHKEISPPPRLSRKRVQLADDQTAEYRVAVALASLGWSFGQKPWQVAPTGDEVPGTDTTEDTTDQEKRIALASQFASLDPEAILHKRRKWGDSQSQTRVVWGTGSLESNLIAVLQRRLIDESVAGPLDAAAPARLADIAAFMDNHFDDARCARLLAGLVWAVPRTQLPFVEPAHPGVPFAYAAIKPIFTPAANLKALDNNGLSSLTGDIPIPPGMVSHLRSGRVNEAVHLALARAHASGIACAFAGRSITQKSKIGRRLAAALLIPLNKNGLRTLIERAYPTEKENEDGD